MTSKLCNATTNVYLTSIDRAIECPLPLDIPHHCCSEHDEQNCCVVGVDLSDFSGSLVLDQASLVAASCDQINLLQVGPKATFTRQGSTLLWTLLDDNFKKGFIYLKTDSQTKFVQLSKSQLSYEFALCENEVPIKFVFCLKIKDTELVFDCSGVSPCPGCEFDILTFDLSGVEEDEQFFGFLPLVVFETGDISGTSIFPKGVSFVKDASGNSQIVTYTYQENVSQFCLAIFEVEGTDASFVQLTLDISGCAESQTFSLNNPSQSSVVEPQFVCVEACNRSISSFTVKTDAIVSFILTYCRPELS